MIAALDGLPEVEKVLSAGTDKSSIVLARRAAGRPHGLPAAAWGTHLVHFTGNEDHNIALRGMALDRGWSLSEKGFKVIEDGSLLDAEEAEVYERLGLPWIAPELREADGEIEAALAGRLPDLVSHDDVRGDTHTHSDWTDGVDSIEVMARAARDLGHEYIVLTDHSPSLGVARGLAPSRVDEQAAEIARVNASSRRSASCTAPSSRSGPTRRSTTPTSCSPLRRRHRQHPHRAQPVRGAADPTRALAAVEHPHVDVLAHPTGTHRQPARPAADRLGASSRRRRARHRARDQRQPAPRPRRLAGAGRGGRRGAPDVASDAHRTEELGAAAVRRRRRAPSVADGRPAARRRGSADALLELVG